MTVDAQTAGFKFHSALERTALLELYTSEGCSSCPPAEAWLSRLRDSPRLWREFAPVAWHVDYWNQLGWKDPWSAAEFSDRQRTYAQRWHDDNIYTPCFILNGQEWRGWVAGQDGPPASRDRAGRLTVVSKDTNRWQAVFMPEGMAATRYEIHAAVLAGGIRSDVKAGENRGRRLNHDFVALNLLQVEMALDSGVAQGEFRLDPSSFRSEKVLALTIWVTRDGQLEPLQATGGWLIPPAQK
ncbi:MAG: DUF1223 domain-containing protein [Verrucomicrobiia bacterium]